MTKKTTDKPPRKRRAAGSSSNEASGKKATAGAKPRKKAAPWLPDLPPAAVGAKARNPERARAASTVNDPYAEREARRYELPIASREAILAYLSDCAEPLSAEQLAEGLQLSAPDRFDALSKRLAAMIRDGQLLMNRRGGYAVASKLDLIAGVVLANADGFGFLRRDGGGDDVFLPPGQMRRVLHGDRVLVSVTGIDRRGRPEGAIVEVLERRTTRLVGRYSESDGIALVAPDDRRINRDIIIPQDARGDARSGQIVACEITQAPSAHRPPFGRILAVLGDALTPSLAVEVAIHGHDLPHEWPQPVLDQASQVPLEVPESDCAGRVDLRDLPLVTIDGETARDFDDAVYCEPMRSGFRLLVAIADVSHYVRPETPLDDEANKRATSVYFPGYVVPMLPEMLSNGICSLNPKVDRLCFVCEMRIDHDGVVKKADFYEAVMRSHARLTYTQVWNAIGENDADARSQIGSLMPQIENLHKLYQQLEKQRRARGAIEFDSGEVEFRLGPAGEVVQAAMQPRNDAHKLIEECMIAANVEAAKFLLKKKIPAPYRVHDRPPESKYSELLEFLSEFGLRLPSHQNVTPGDYTALLKKIRLRPDSALLESVLLRSQSLAVYTPDNLGHFGLALEAYAHFTSPIRRYPDLLVHRGIKHALLGGRGTDYLYAPHDMAALSLHCSEVGRRAEEAEREVDERYRCAFMERHVGSTFNGVVSGVTSFGLFVELIESRVTGLVHVTQLPNDYYHFDPARRLLRGERAGSTFRLGDTVRIQVLRASIDERRIDFRLADEHDSPPRGPLPEKRRKSDDGDRKPKAKRKR